MRNKIITFALIFTFLMISSSFSLLITAQEDEEELWDFEGVMGVKSDERRIVIFNPTDHGFDETIDGYDSPLLYLAVIGLDLNDDEELDIYYGFYGISFFDLSHYNLTTAPINLFRIIVNAHWRLRIPQEAKDAGIQWEVLYYPNPLYNEISTNLEFNAPIYYVNLTKREGVNLEYRIDFGLNYTRGNFSTFGTITPLVPEMPTFPGYNVSVPLFTKTDIIEELVATDFFGNMISFVTIVSFSFILLYVFRKRRKRKIQTS